ncbi:hypothetical protein JL722_10288 [Aureococcus anophagefferens]|nr:hypothetical protein JL722_10288 [Aureococcus anophagefferens]
MALVDDGVVGSEGDSEASVAFLRREWIEDELEARLDQFAEVHDIRVVCGTWNANGKNMPTLDLDLTPGSPAAAGGDAYAAGAQEMVDLTAANVLTEGKSAKRADAWVAMLEAALARLPGGVRYERLASRHLVGVFLAVFARSEPARPGGFSAAKCSQVDDGSAGVGVMGMLGNKGGCAVRFRAFDTTVCVSAHLAAHRGNVEGRNADVAAICAKVEFRNVDDVSTPTPATAQSDDAPPLPPRAPDRPSAPPAPAPPPPPRRILDHDVVFWLGDLNYRVREGIATAECFARAEARDDAFLLANDQLNLERAAGRVFAGFDEGPIGFPVTYKYEAGTSRLEQRPEKKLRAPAWCDRVLWKSRRAVALEDYDSDMSLEPSDHKPVRASLRARVLEVLPAKKRAVERAVIAALDGLDASRPPEVSCELLDDVPGDGDRYASSRKRPLPGLVDLGDVRYGQKVVRTIALKNVGEAPAHWRFVGRAFDGAGASLDAAPRPRLRKDWLALSRTRGTLLPGDVALVDVVVRVRTRAARRLNAAVDALAEVLVLHVDRAPGDRYVKFAGTWVPSAWGRDLADLCGRGADRDDATVAAPVPRELYRLVDALSAKRDAANLFFEAGPEADVDAVRRALDASAPLPDGLRAWGADFLAALPDAHYNTFVYVVAFFKELLASADRNLLTPARLSVVVCGAMLPSDDHGDLDKETLYSKHYFNAVVQYFLTAPMG